MIEEALKAVLKANAAVAGITRRMYPATLPQNPSFPLIRYIKIGGAPERHLKGPSSLNHGRFQIESWDRSYAGAKALARAVQGCLDGHRGTAAGVSIESCILLTEQDSYADSVKCELVIQDYSIWYRES